MQRFPLSKIKKILIVKMSSIGDVIHALPTLTVLRKNFPQAHIDWIVESKAYDILAGHPYLDEIILVDLESIGKQLKSHATFVKGLAEIKKLANKLRLADYDLVLDLQGLAKSGLVSFFTGAPLRLVVAKNREGSRVAATHVVPSNPDSLHAVQRYLDVLRFLGISIADGEDEEFVLDISLEEEKFSQEFLRKHGLTDNDKIIGLNPGAAWITKQWPPRHFAALGDLLAAKGYQIVIFGGPGDIDLVKKITAMMEHKSIMAAGKTNLKELAALIKKCAVFIGNDTGPMHLAIAVGTPVVAIFGPTHHIYTGPYGSNQIVVRKQMVCAPCFQAKKCPKYTKVECLESISPQEVWVAAKKFLS